MVSCEPDSGNNIEIHESKSHHTAIGDMYLANLHYDIVLIMINI